MASTVVTATYTNSIILKILYEQYLYRKHAGSPMTLIENIENTAVHCSTGVKVTRKCQSKIETL